MIKTSYVISKRKLKAALKVMKTLPDSEMHQGHIIKALKEMKEWKPDELKSDKLLKAI